MSKMFDWIDETLDNVSDASSSAKTSIVGNTKKLFDKFNGDSNNFEALIDENPKKALKTMAIPAFFSLFCLSLIVFLFQNVVRQV